MLVDEILLNLKTAYDSGPIKKLLADLDQVGKAVEKFTQKSESGLKQFFGKFGSWKGQLDLFTGGFNRLASSASGWLSLLDGKSAGTVQSFLTKTQGALAEVNKYANEITTVFQIGQAGFALLGNPITWIAVAIALVIFLVSDLMAYLKGGESLLGSYWDPIIEGAQELIVWIEEAVDALLAWWGKAGPAIMVTLSAIWVSVKTIVGGIVDFIVKRWDVIKAALAGAFQAAKGILQIFAGVFRVLLSLITGDTEETADAFKQIWEGIKNFFVGVGEFLLGVFELFGDAIMAVMGLINDWLLGELEKIKNFFIAIWEFLLSVFGLIGNAIMMAMSAVIDGLMIIWDGFKEHLFAIWNGLTDTVTNVFEGIKAACSEAVAWILEVFQPVTNLLSGIGSSISGFFGNGKPKGGTKSGGFFGWIKEKALGHLSFDPKNISNQIEGARSAYMLNNQGVGAKGFSLAQNNSNNIYVTGSSPRAIANEIASTLARDNRNATENAGSAFGV